MLRTWMVDVQQVFDLLDLELPTFVTASGEKREFDEANIEFKDVTFGYPDSEPLFKNLSFKVEAGKSVAIVG